MKTLLSTIALSLLAGATTQAAISFTFTGTLDDADNTPFSITYSGPDTSPASGTYDSNSRVEPGDYLLQTETIAETPIFDSISGDIFGGSYSRPELAGGPWTPADDGYYAPSEYIEFYESSFPSSGSTYLYMWSAADYDDLGLEYEGEPIDYMEFYGYLDGVNRSFPDSDSTLLSEALPIGTFDFSNATGWIYWDGGFIRASPTQVRIVPEPSAAALLGLGGLALLLRRRAR
jgi:hypothetical protein